MKAKVQAKELINSIREKYRVLGSLNRYVSNTQPIDRADDESLSFCRIKGEQALKMIGDSRAKVIICSDELDLSEAAYQDKTFILVSNPKLTYSRLLTRYFTCRLQPGIHPSAIVDENAEIGQGVYIGPQCYIGDCKIGDGTVIKGHVYINAGTRIGKDVIVHSGVIIGTEAISFVRNEEKELEWFPQLGGVVIEDEVEIGANSVISRGPLSKSDTIIGKGTKIDILVEVGHGVRVGKHCIIVGHTILCGRVKIGDYTYISSQVCIREGVTVGSRAFIGMGSVVLKDIPDNLVVIGSPARPLRENVI